MNLAALQRLAHRCHRRNFGLAARLLYRIAFFIFNSSVPPEVVIGAGSKFAYGGIGVVINKKAVIGENCVLGQGITIGGRGKDRPGEAVLEDGVYVGAGVRILGPVRIGSYAIIAPNSVVLNDVEAGCIVAGIPARVIRRGISDENQYLYV